MTPTYFERSQGGSLLQRDFILRTAGSGALATTTYYNTKPDGLPLAKIDDLHRPFRLGDDPSDSLPLHHFRRTVYQCMIPILGGAVDW